MQSADPAAMTVFIMFAAYGFMGAWDGLVRRHIRVRVATKLPGLSLSVAGPLAMLMGSVCALFLFALVRVAAPPISATVMGCPDPGCALGRLFGPLFTNLTYVIILVAVAATFVPWLWGIRDMEGPFRTQLLAPGVWFRERECVTRAQQRLRAAGQPPVDVNAILKLVDALVLYFGGLSPTMSVADPSETPPTREMVVQALANSTGWTPRNVSAKARRLMVEAIALYMIEQYEAAERRWPWRRRFLETVP